MYMVCILAVIGFDFLFSLDLSLICLSYRPDRTSPGYSLLDLDAVSPAPSDDSICTERYIK